MEYFRPFVEQGYEVVHLNLGSALSKRPSELYAGCPGTERSLSGGFRESVHRDRPSGTGRRRDDQSRYGSGRNRTETKGEKEPGPFQLYPGYSEIHERRGRCSNVLALGANLLNIKPCIEVNNQDGSMGRGKEIPGIFEKVLPLYVKEKLRGYKEIRRDKIFITHSGITQDYIELVRRPYRKKWNFRIFM